MKVLGTFAEKITQNFDVPIEFLSTFQLECFIWAELGTTKPAIRLGSKASLFIDHAHDPVLEEQASLDRVRLARVHAQATTQAFLFVNLGTKYLVLSLPLGNGRLHN